MTNDIPAPGKAEDILVGRNGLGKFNFYNMFSGNGQGGAPSSKSKGGKPFFITETAATIHVSVNSAENGWMVPAGGDPESRKVIKQTWWRQMINSTFLSMYPKIKGIAFFEFVKFEETSWRDFASFGQGSNVHTRFANDSGFDDSTLRAFREDLDGPLGRLVIWGNESSIVLSKPPDVVVGSVPQITGSNSKNHASAASLDHWFMFLLLLLI